MGSRRSTIVLSSAAWTLTVDSDSVAALDSQGRLLGTAAFPATRSGHVALLARTTRSTLASRRSEVDAVPSPSMGGTVPTPDGTSRG